VALTGDRTFVGFGFGPIQAGLFCYEAFQSGNFSRLVAAEVLPEIVGGIRDNGGWFSVNIAHRDRIESVRLGPIQLEDPGHDADRRRLVEAVADADEIATAIPSVEHYATDGPGSLHRILADGLQRKCARGGPRAVVYTAENHNHAAEILEGAVRDALPPDGHDALRERVRFLNTVVGKMSGTSRPGGGLSPVAPAVRRAFLVESFNRILVSTVDFGDSAKPFRRGIGTFEEKPDLLPFEHAKLYGHNATHALAAYLGCVRRVRMMSELRKHADVLGFLRTAFLEESGTTLISMHRGIDPLFTPDGYREYCDDLLERMLNPYLGDTVERVGRDPRRKLGWDDRLIGLIRLALGAGVHPARYALGAAAALAKIEPRILATDIDPAPLLEEIWGESPRPVDESASVARLVRNGAVALRRIYGSECQDLGRFP